MRAASFSKACILAVLLLAAFGKAGTSLVCRPLLGQTLRAFRSDFHAIEGERPSLDPFDRLVLSVILADPHACRK